MLHHQSHVGAAFPS
jgi:hypothetical protein